MSFEDGEEFLIKNTPRLTAQEMKEREKMSKVLPRKEALEVACLCEHLEDNCPNCSRYCGQPFAVNEPTLCCAFCILYDTSECRGDICRKLEVKEETNENQP